MKVRYDEGRDLTLTLTDEENEMLFSGPTMFFDDMHVGSEELVDGRHYILLRGIIRGLGEYVFLGCSKEVLGGASDFGMGKIVIPDGGTWLINLNDEGLRHYKDGWESGVRYDGSHKLFIKGVDCYDEC